jgi:S1-C subfamily serine protease
MTYLRKEKDGFAIADFPEQSVSEAAGLKIGDVITFIDDVKAETIEDIKIHLLYKKKGDMVRIKILREEEGEIRELEIDVEL